MTRTTVLAAALASAAFPAMADVGTLTHRHPSGTPDLAVTSLRIQMPEISVPSGFGFHFRVANLGDATVKGMSRNGLVRLIVYLTKNPQRPPAGPLTPPPRDTFHPERPLGVMGIIPFDFDISPRFHSREVGRAVRLPAGIPPGRWWFCAMIDAYDVVPERNERNNIRCQPLRIVPPDQAAGGTRADTSREHRHGAKDRDEARRKIVREILGRLVDREGRTTRRSKPRRERERPPEQAQTEVPPSACPLDGPLPNLRAVGVKAPTKLYRDGRPRAAAAMRNRGRGTVPAHDGECGPRLHVVLSRSGEITAPAAGGYGDGTYVVLDVAADRVLAPGERFSVRARDSFLDLSGVPRGRYWLCVVADPYNGVPESDETDNVRCEYKVSVF